MKITYLNIIIHIDNRRLTKQERNVEQLFRNIIGTLFK
jgi:hypothetical protein